MDAKNRIPDAEGNNGTVSAKNSGSDFTPSILINVIHNPVEHSIFEQVKK
jgi:hypothetical protein